MGDIAILWEWAAFALRWLHVITAIAWIGSSFYFIALDLGLNRNIPGPADGEEWQVHGGGFYHIQKYLVAPQAMPDHLTWFKWESYATWLSGAALLIVVYWAGAELYMIDPGKAELSRWSAIGISIAVIVGGWFVYDGLCRSALGYRPVVLMAILFILLVALAWGLWQVLTGRAAMLHLGALTATIMSANVFLVIIPNQKIVVADLRAGRSPDAEYGRIAKLRSLHNNYLTLPVVFFMLSNHNPLAFATDLGWLIAALVFLMGVTIRHYFNTAHARKGRANWTWAVTAILFLCIAWASSSGSVRGYDDAAYSDPGLVPGDGPRRLAASEDFGAVHVTVVGRCSMCHAVEPVWPGVRQAPKGVILETEADVLRHARQIYVHAGLTHAMPPGNLVGMEEGERALIRRWVQNARGS